MPDQTPNSTDETIDFSCVLPYLQGSCTLELHQSFGQDYRTVAACQLVFKDIFDKPQGRIHGMAVLTGKKTKVLKKNIYVLLLFQKMDLCK